MGQWNEDKGNQGNKEVRQKNGGKRLRDKEGEKEEGLSNAHKEGKWVFQHDNNVSGFNIVMKLIN